MPNLLAHLTRPDVPHQVAGQEMPDLLTHPTYLPVQHDVLFGWSLEDSEPVQFLLYHRCPLIQPNLIQGIRPMHGEIEELISFTDSFPYCVLQLYLENDHIIVD